MPGVNYERRYFNVFFGYRGAAIDDATLTGGRQLEDNLTRALAIALERASSATRRSFANDICGTEVVVPGPDQVELQPVPGGLEAAQTRLLGISVGGKLNPGSLEVNQGGSRPDAALKLGEDFLVLVESKAVDLLDGGQLARHAFRWDVDEPKVTVNGLLPPNTWSLVRWDQISAWARRAAQAEDSQPGSFLLSELAEYLDLAGVTDSRPIPRPPVPTESRTPAWLVDLAEAADLDEVALACSRLYSGPDGEGFVAGDGASGPVDTRADSRRVAQAFRKNHESVPPRLLQMGGNVITARRALSILYGPDGYERSVAEPDTRNRVALLRAVGTDRAVLLGVLAWAWPRSGQLAEYARRIVATGWSQVPPVSHVAPELHEALSARTRAAIGFNPRTPPAM